MNSGSLRRNKKWEAWSALMSTHSKVWRDELELKMETNELDIKLNDFSNQVWASETQIFNPFRSAIWSFYFFLSNDSLASLDNVCFIHSSSIGSFFDWHKNFFTQMSRGVRITLDMMQWSAPLVWTSEPNTFFNFFLFCFLFFREMNGINSIRKNFSPCPSPLIYFRWAFNDVLCLVAWFFEMM